LPEPAHREDALADRSGPKPENAMGERAAPGGHETRDRIARAALGVFAAQGYDGTTTRQIADTAGVNLGLLQYHFGAKEKLWRASVDVAFAELERGLERVSADADAISDDERVRRLIRNHVRFTAHHPEFVRIMHDVGKRPGPRTEWLVETHVAPLYRGIVELAKRSGRRLNLPPDLPPIHFHYILAGAVGLIFHQAEECRLLAGIDPFDEAHVEAHARAVEYLLLGPPDDRTRAASEEREEESQP